VLSARTVVPPPNFSAESVSARLEADGRGSVWITSGAFAVRLAVVTASKVAPRRESQIFDYTLVFLREFFPLVQV